MSPFSDKPNNPDNIKPSTCSDVSTNNTNPTFNRNGTMKTTNPSPTPSQLYAADLSTYSTHPSPPHLRGLDQRLRMNPTSTPTSMTPAKETLNTEEKGQGKYDGMSGFTRSFGLREDGGFGGSSFHGGRGGGDRGGNGSGSGNGNRGSKL